EKYKTFTCHAHSEKAHAGGVGWGHLVAESPATPSSTKSLGLLPADKRLPPSSSVGFMAKLRNADGKRWQLQIDFVELAVNVSTHETPFFAPHVQFRLGLLPPRPQTSSEFSSF
ncbi:hypothetical protein IscW_ISCW007348, partial [Ixodes scapularis]